MPRRKYKHGGRRRGAGRPPSNRTVALLFTVHRDTAAKLERKAKELGLVKRPGGPPYLGAVVDMLVEAMPSTQPEYLKLAQSA